MAAITRPIAEASRITPRIERIGDAEFNAIMARVMKGWMMQDNSTIGLTVRLIDVRELRRDDIQQPVSVSFDGGEAEVLIAMNADRVEPAGCSWRDG